MLEDSQPAAYCCGLGFFGFFFVECFKPGFVSQPEEAPFALPPASADHSLSFSYRLIPL
jgi:hypothetical protein